jgi:hypothetical protein
MTVPETEGEGDMIWGELQFIETLLVLHSYLLGHFNLVKSESLVANAFLPYNKLY